MFVWMKCVNVAPLRAAIDESSTQSVALLVNLQPPSELNLNLLKTLNFLIFFLFMPQGETLHPPRIPRLAAEVGGSVV